MRTVEDSDQPDASPGNVLVESLAMSLGHPVTDQPGNPSGHLPALVNGFLDAGGATTGARLGWTVLLRDVAALLLVDLAGLAVAGGLVHGAALSPGLLVGDLGAFLLGDLGAAHTTAVPLLRGVPPLTPHHITIISSRHVRL